VLDDVSLAVAKGEFIAIIGHSGCGKSTLLNIVAGLTQATRGVVVLDGKGVDRPGPDRAVVFQNHSLLPWLTVYENVRLAVDKVHRALPMAARHELTLRNLELVHMTHALERRPAEISGGMKQRVGIARALAMSPKVLLLDEPFGALDAFTREELWCALRDLHAAQKFNVILVTHDLRESVFLADTVYCMSKSPGRFVVKRQIDLPRPRDLEVTYTPEFTDIVHELRGHIGATRAKAGALPQ
jgi:NitT/TauT family transport system ATP-binding protein